MKGLAINTENKMQFKDYSTPVLNSISKEVDGYIEIVRPKYLPEGFCMVVNDEGLLRNLPLNQIACFLYGTPEHGQPIVGNVVILREAFVDDGLDFVDMTDNDQTTLTALMSLYGDITTESESEAK